MKEETLGLPEYCCILQSLTKKWVKPTEYVIDFLDDHFIFCLLDNPLMHYI